MNDSAASQPLPRNAFNTEFLSWIDDRDEPSSVGEADAAGPWTVRHHPQGGFAVLRVAERLEDGDHPAGVFRRAETARLAAAILPGSGRPPAFRLQPAAGSSGFALEGDGELAGHLRLFDADLVAALNVADSMVRSPEALAWLLEAAGRVALEHTGRILAHRVFTQEPVSAS